MRGHEHQDWVQRGRAVPIEKEIERRGIKLKRVGVELVGPCPKCGGDDRFAINVKKQVFNCRGCGIKGDVIALVERLDGCDFNAACTTLTGELPPKKADGKGDGKHADTSKKVVVATFEYTDENGNVLSAADRIEFQMSDGSFALKDGKHDKVFRQRRPDPGHPGKWIHNVTGVRVVPYRLPELLEAIAAGHPIVVVEGEAKANLLWSWGVAATCCAGGAEKWKPEHSVFLRDADVVLLPDNDAPGFKHAAKVGAMLSGIAKRLRLLVLPDLPPKGDIKDWADASGTREQLDALVEQAQDYYRPLALKADTADDGDKREYTHNDSDRESGLSALPPPSQPMAVARIFADECLHGGVLTLRCWRGGWWMWKTTHWIEAEDGAVRSVLYRFTENAFYFDGKAPRPWAPNRHKISDLIDALRESVSCLTMSISPVGWIEKRLRMALLSRSKMVCLTLLAATSSRIRPHTLTRHPFPLHTIPAHLSHDVG